MSKRWHTVHVFCNFGPIGKPMPLRDRFGRPTRLEFYTVPEPLRIPDHGVWLLCREAGT